MQLWIINTVVFHLAKINLLWILDLLIFFKIFYKANSRALSNLVLSCHDFVFLQSLFPFNN